MHHQEGEDGLHRLEKEFHFSLYLRHPWRLETAAGSSLFVKWRVVSRTTGWDTSVKVLYRKLAGSPRQSPPHLCLSSPVGFLRFPGLFKTLRSPDCHPPPSCLFGSDANRDHSLLTFATLELHTHIRCKWSIDLQPGRGKSSPRWHFKVALGLCNGHPSCAHQNLNDTSTFTPLWKTRPRLISAPVLRIPEDFHEAF